MEQDNKRNNPYHGNRGFLEFGVNYNGKGTNVRCFRFLQSSNVETRSSYILLDYWNNEAAAWSTYDHY